MTSKAVAFITEHDINKAQKQWGDGLIRIGEAYSAGNDHAAVAEAMIDSLYGYDFEKGVVLFKPTKAKEVPFRKTRESALSYFIGGNEKFSEDKGFALEPWVVIEFNNHAAYFHGDFATSMGEYIFHAKSGHQVRVEYTFGYVKDPSSDLKIILHHSSLPYCE